MVISITRLTFFYLFYLFIFFALNVYHRSQTHSSCEHLRTTNENVCLKLMVYASSYLFPVFFSPFFFSFYYYSFLSTNRVKCRVYNTHSLAAVTTTTTNYCCTRSGAFSKKSYVENATEMKRNI